LTTGPPRYLLLDTYKRGRYGGAGEVFDWTVAPRYAALGLPLLIAGGLNPGNVRAALEATHPAGVDVSSGVERAPGLKDPDLMRTFVRAVREFSAP
jgi:phosphoribosylanthranilate isomerase